MNTQYRKRLPNTELDYFDTREAVNAIEAGAYEKQPKIWCVVVIQQS
jgi:hypothetical protein